MKSLFYIKKYSKVVKYMKKGHCISIYESLSVLYIFYFSFEKGFYRTSENSTDGQIRLRHAQLSGMVQILYHSVK